MVRIASSPKPSCPAVWLVCGEHWGLVWHLPRLLCAAGAEVTLLAPPGQPFRFSRHVRAYLPLSHHAPTAARELAALAAQKQPDLILHAAQNIVECLAAFAPLDGGLVPGLRDDFRAAIQNKTEFQSWAEACSLPIPLGRVCADPREASAWVEEHGRSILKTNGVHGGFGVAVAARPADVAAAWETLGRPGSFLIQEFLAGAVGVTEMLVRRGEPLAWYSSFKERVSRPLGASVMRRLHTPPGMAALVVRIARATGWHGLCGFDWILSQRDGSVRILEFHPRAPSGFGYAKYTGVDLPAALRDLLADRAAPPRVPMGDDGLARAPLCCHFPSHLAYACRHRRADLRFWLPGSRAISWQNVPWTDPGPLLALLVRLLRRRVPRPL